MTPLYFDHNSTTPVLPEVIDAMRPYFLEAYGNASVGHAYGQAARAGLERARDQVAAAIGCDSDEVVFTGGSSEANNLAVKGTAWALRERGRHIVHSAVEHPSIRGAAAWLCAEGATVTEVGVDAQGAVRAADMVRALRDDTVLCALMVAQNEVGTLMPVTEVARAARARGVRMLADASQAVGKIEVDVRALDVDLCVIAAHKFHGPKGVGAIYVRRGTPLVPLVHGVVSHEHGLRAGTVNVPGIVGMGAAIALCTQRLAVVRTHLLALRARLLEGLRARIPDLVVNGHIDRVLPNTLHVCIPEVDSTALLQRIPHVALSTGAACQWGKTSPSPVLCAMGLPPALALGALRFSMGAGNTAEEVDRVVSEVADQVDQMRLSEARR